jgi:ABC-type phosphate transport system substrate-binding protein
MSGIRHRTRRIWWTAMPAALAITALSVAVPPAGAASHAPPAGAGPYVAISGSGTDWSSIAIDQWAQAVRQRGIVVNYNPDGSAAGRADYIANQDDYAASDPPFRSQRDQLGGTGPEHPTQGYSYIPDVAGGTAFPYHITVHGHLVTNLRLTPQLLFDIFTGKITNWDNPQIKKVYGGTLPNLPITPVIHSDGDGATYFLSRYFATMFTSQWNAFCKSVHPGIHDPCGPTEFYPPFGRAKAENGTNNVMAYITSTFGNGSIGYAEYAYALNAHYPVVQVRNPAGKYVLPTAANVTTALTRAVIDEDASSRNFLQQNLTRVYAYTNPASYPLASYSYLIVPREGTRLPTNFTKAKGHTLRAFVSYLLCRGQRHLSQLGYAPLPPGLVAGGLLQAAHIPGQGPVPTPAHCR